MRATAESPDSRETLPQQVDGRVRVIIEGVRLEIDCGRSPARSWKGASLNMTLPPLGVPVFTPEANDAA
jgi:hypothetical protein